jgi:WD40 repeat protein
VKHGCKNIGVHDFPLIGLGFCTVIFPRDQPIHLIDAYTGAIRCSYRAYDSVDAVEAAQCVSFTNDGQKIFAGFNRCIKIFHTSQPGRDCSDVLYMGTTKRSNDGQKGIVSAIAFPSSATTNIFAVGTYAGSIFLYDDRVATGNGNPSGIILSNLGIPVVEGQGNHKKNGWNQLSKQSNMAVEEENIFAAAKNRWFQQIGRRGITQLKFLSSDDNILFSASRKSNAVVSWDMRMLGSAYQGRSSAGLASYERDGDTNQKLQFDTDEERNRLFVGSRDKCVNIYDISTKKIISKISGLSDAANGVSYSRSNKMLAVSIGARSFPTVEDYDDDSLSALSSFVAPPGFLDLYMTI